MPDPVFTLFPTKSELQQDLAYLESLNTADAWTEQEIENLRYDIENY